MCGHGHHGHGHGRGRAFGFRGFGRGGFPNREQWLDRLQAYQGHLEEELRNVQELIERLGPAAPGAPEQTANL
jgi:hypothetical protein